MVRSDIATSVSINVNPRDSPMWKCVLFRFILKVEKTLYGSRLNVEGSVCACSGCPRSPFDNDHDFWLLRIIPPVGTDHIESHVIDRDFRSRNGDGRLPVFGFIQTAIGE